MVAMPMVDIGASGYFLDFDRIPTGPKILWGA